MVACCFELIVPPQLTLMIPQRHRLASWIPSLSQVQQVLKVPHSR